MGARISKFLWLLGINEKIICSKSQVSTFTGSRNNGLKPAFFLARVDFSQYFVCQSLAFLMDSFHIDFLSSLIQQPKKTDGLHNIFLTGRNYFGPNQSGIGSFQLNSNHCIYTISQFCWVGGGGGLRYRNDFFENHFFNL